MKRYDLFDIGFALLMGWFVLILWGVLVAATLTESPWFLLGLPIPLAFSFLYAGMLLEVGLIPGSPRKWLDEKLRAALAKERVDR